jgi:hypothetical protein
MRWRRREREEPDAGGASAAGVAAEKPISESQKARDDHPTNSKLGILRRKVTTLFLGLRPEKVALRAAEVRS